jgi:SAM-dependent MidA family methyltransferase
LNLEGQPELVALIRDGIRQSGPVSFAWFMEQALYHPQFGYYASGRAQIGRTGDYFTNVSVGPLFGQLLAGQFIEIWMNLGKPNDFWLVEQGAHHGELAADVLGAIRELSADFFSAIRYCIVESFEILRDRQQETLARFGNKVLWRDSVGALEPFIGTYFCNELLDSFPVHLIVSQSGTVRKSGRGLSAATSATEVPWLEKCVGVKDDRFVFVEQPITNSKLQAAAHALPVRPAAYTTEVNLTALDWLDEVSRKLARGYLLAVDYGHTRDDFYAADRTAGTLQIRSRHRLLDSPFRSIGHADITAHVEWTSLAERAEQRGLQVAGFTDQHHFLTGIISAQAELFGNNNPQSTRALKTLLHPEMLGRTFQVLALSKEIEPTRTMSGFQFARPARKQLGI